MIYNIYTYWYQQLGCIQAENSESVAFISIVVHTGNHFLLLMNLSIDFDVSPPEPRGFFRIIFNSAAFAVTKR